jgi:hypothetical protein
VHMAQVTWRGLNDNTHVLHVPQHELLHLHQKKPGLLSSAHGSG